MTAKCVPVKLLADVSVHDDVVSSLRYLVRDVEEKERTKLLGGSESQPAEDGDDVATEENAGQPAAKKRRQENAVARQKKKEEELAARRISLVHSAEPLVLADSVEVYVEDHLTAIVLILPDEAVSQLASCEQLVPYFEATVAALSPELQENCPFVVLVQTLGKRKLPATSTTMTDQLTEVALKVPPVKSFRPTGSFGETAAFIMSIAEYYHKGSHLKKRPLFTVNCKQKADGDLRKVYHSMLCEIPTISERRAMSIMSVFTTLGSLLRALEANDVAALGALERAVDFGEPANRKLGSAVVATLRDALLMTFDEAQEL